MALALGALLVSGRLAAAQDAQCELLPSASGGESSGFAIVKLAPLPPDESVAFSAYLLPKNEEPADRFRIQSLFPWFSGDVCLLHLRGWPQGVSGAVDLLLEVSRDGKATRFRIEKATTLTERRTTVAVLVDDSYSMRRHDPDKLRMTATKTFGVDRS